jgi:TRAP-type C4-dicarboxylate transport system permease small subunit
MQLAQITNPVLGPTGNQSGISFLQKFIPAAINLAFVAAAVIFLFMLIFGAIQWISSGGDKQALESARGRITSALIGIVILFALFAILNLISNFFGGVPILNLSIPSLTEINYKANPITR